VTQLLSAAQLDLSAGTGPDSDGSRPRELTGRVQDFRRRRPEDPIRSHTGWISPELDADRRALAGAPAGESDGTRCEFRAFDNRVRATPEERRPVSTLAGRILAIGSMALGPESTPPSISRIADPHLDQRIQG